MQPHEGFSMLEFSNKIPEQVRRAISVLEQRVTELETAVRHLAAAAETMHDPVVSGKGRQHKRV